MKKTNWINLSLIAILAVFAAACGRGGAVAGHTYVSSQQGYGAQSGYYGYNNGYNYGYNNGYNYGYNNGSMLSGAGDTISFDNNMRATYRSASMNTTLTGTYSFTDSSNNQLQFIPDATAQTSQMMGMTGPIRFTVANDGSYITNLNTGSMMYRQ